MSKRILYLGLDPTHYSANGEIIHWPIIEIIPRPLSDPAIQQALTHFPVYSHVIVTSKSTVAILLDYLTQLKIDLQIWHKKITLAVGKVTAKHLYACGIIPSRIAQEETAEGIIQELKQLRLEQAHLFWPHSAKARVVIKEFLMAQSIQHTTCMLYDPKPKIPNTLPNLEDFDEIVFTSPSTVDAFLQIFGSFPSHISLAAIGPITADYLKSKSFIENIS
jgi:uroporphyrinogen-III synthase